MIDTHGNTLESIEKDCASPGWYATYSDGRPNDAVSPEVIAKAKLIQPFVPLEMELFPCPDGSVQWEDNGHTLEVYADKYKFDDTAMPFEDAVRKLVELDYTGKGFKLELTFPKEFRGHFQMDRFADSLGRVAFDVAHSLDSIHLSGNYEKELLEKLVDVFKSAKVVK